MARHRILKYPGMTDKAVRDAAQDQAAMLSDIKNLLEQQVQMLSYLVAEQSHGTQDAK